MDRDTLDSLETALEASPDNLQLRFVVVRARLELDEVDAAAELLASVDPSTVTTAADRLTAGTILRRADRADDALSYLDGDDPATRVEKARALHALGRGAEALREHAAAVADDPSVEDGVLAAELSRSGAAEEEGTESEQRGPLRLVSSGPEHVDDSLDTLLRPQHQPVTFDDIGGLEQVKKQVRKKILLPFQKPSIFARFRKRVGGGILMYGPPGCGKTLLARATAGECSARFLSVAISDILDMYIGESERKLHALFETARQETPSVLFFDEVEALGARRQSTRDSTSAKLVSQFLAEMDGFTQDNH
ncbi:MAG: ATP-binding protein, partial [Acidobacteriota bacterium]